MIRYLIFLLLTIAAISKGQHQQKLQVEQQKIQEKSTPSEEPYRPISFPDDDDDDEMTRDKLPPQNQTENVNLILQSVDQKFPAHSPSMELTRPTRVAAANAPIITSRYTDDQLDYIRDFSWKLFQGSKLPSAIGNLVLSPIQPQLQLSLLRTAAAGLTEEEIAHAIGEVTPSITNELVHHLRTTNSIATNLGVASAMFTKNNFQLNNSFISAAHDRDVNIVPVNFESPDETKYVINNWVANATNNRIKEFLKPEHPISTDTQVILTNSIYFNGEWKYGFTEVKTEEFHTTEKLSKNVEMMKNLVSLRSSPLHLRNGLAGQWAELPYRGDEFSMVIVIPNQKYRLDEFIRSMHATDFSDIVKQLSGSYKKLVHLSMPKFTIQSSFSLVNPLLKMGIVDLFSQTSRLPYLANAGNELHIQDILQNGFLSVDEKGTVAAAATISHVVTLSLNSAPEEIHFNVDQPFLSIIVDKRNKIPVFISKIFDP